MSEESELERWEAFYAISGDAEPSRFMANGEVLGVWVTPLSRDRILAALAEAKADYEEQREQFKRRGGEIDRLERELGEAKSHLRALLNDLGGYDDAQTPQQMVQRVREEITDTAAELAAAKALLGDHNAGWDAAERGEPMDDSRSIHWLDGWEYYQCDEECRKLKAENAAVTRVAKAGREIIRYGETRTKPETRWEIAMDDLRRALSALDASEKP